MIAILIGLSTALANPEAPAAAPAGDRAHAAHEGGSVPGVGAHAGGDGAHAEGDGAHAEGDGAHAGSDGAHAEGDGAHAEGAHHVRYTHDDDADGTANWLDSDAGDAYQVEKLLKHGLNFLVLVGLFVRFAWRPLTDMLRSRALHIRNDLESSANLREAAAARAADAEARLAKVEAEVERIRAQAVSEAEAEAQRLVARAHEEARRISETAERNIRDEVVRARLALRRESVDLAVKLAESVLAAQVHDGDHEKLARELLTSLDRSS